MTFLVLAQQTLAQPPASLGPMWEMVKGVMLTLSTAAVLWTARMVFYVRDEVREIKHELFGRDGTNGIKSSVKSNAERLDRIDARNIAADAVHAAERELCEGDDRRHQTRRIMDIIKEQQGQ